MPSKICMEFPIATHCSLRSLLKFWWSIYVSSDYSSKIVVFLISGSNWVIEIDPLGLCFEICITLEVNHIVKIFKIKVVSVLVCKRGNWPLDATKASKSWPVKSRMRCWGCLIRTHSEWWDRNSKSIMVTHVTPRSLIILGWTDITVSKAIRTELGRTNALATWPMIDNSIKSWISFVKITDFWLRFRTVS